MNFTLYHLVQTRACGFYEKSGYRVIGQLTDYPPGATYFWLRKDFVT